MMIKKSEIFSLPHPSASPNREAPLIGMAKRDSPRMKDPGPGAKASRSDFIPDRS